MKKLKIVFLILVLCLFITTGCWDRRELNDLAIILAWGMDLTKDGTLQGSAQIVIPSKLGGNSGNSAGGGGANEGFLLETATGKTATDVSQNMQTKLSRTMFASHRRVIILGEDLAKNGIAKILDEFSRNPDVRLRTDIFIVRGTTAREFLSNPYKLEKIPAIAPLKIHVSVGGTESDTFKRFLADSNSGGSIATLPIVEMVGSGDQGSSGEKASKTFKISGRAVFNNNLKMIGALTPPETNDNFWVKGELKSSTLTVFVPEGNGHISLVGRKFKSKIKPTLQDDKVKFFVRLTGRGIIMENNTDLDLKNPSHLKTIERAINKNVHEQVKKTISHIQKDFKADIFGFGEALHRKYPKNWKQLKGNWNEKFAEAEIVVQVDVTIEQVGSTGPSLQLKESEILR